MDNKSKFIWLLSNENIIITRCIITSNIVV